MTSAQSDITEVAKKVRRDFGRCVDFQCIILTTMLVDVLRGLGYDVRHVYGAIHVEGNYATTYGHPPVHWDDKYDDIEWMDHHWAAVGDLIIDISADQFNPLMRKGNKFKAVMVGPESQFPFHELIREER